MESNELSSGTLIPMIEWMGKDYNIYNNTTSLLMKLTEKKERYVGTRICRT